MDEVEVLKEFMCEMMELGFADLKDEKWVDLAAIIVAVVVDKY